MPLYEYHCETCDKEFELLIQRRDDSPLCPECGSKKLTKLLSVIGSPVIGENAGQRSAATSETCGRPQCARGCMFDN
ncbi:MAG: zinc ribbon domain-containing protein [Pirellula sp.]|jgi:putative FmdB family regulatory protein|nr:zinc ribbon domain-containing protein [Pirellula sp.]